MRLSVIIPTLDERDLIGAAIDRVRAGDHVRPGHGLCDVPGELRRQRRVGMQEQQHIASGHGRPGIHLPAASRL